MEAAIRRKLTDDRAISSLGGAEVRVVTAPRIASERDALLAWLDAGLRPGRRGRLRAEYGPVLEDATTGHAIARLGKRLLSHAMYRVCDVRMAELRWRVGMIGLVYTAPEARGEGLARECIAHALEAISGAGGQLALLWSDKPEFYARQGFAPAGREVFLRVDGAVRSRLARALDDAWQVEAPRSSDWERLEALYRGGGTRLDRRSGLLRGLASAPECILRVARRRGEVCAYAAFGRGDDFRNVVHEWAGDSEGVIACIHDLAQGAEELAVVGGPSQGAGSVAARLRDAGAGEVEASLALMRVLDAQGLLDSLPPSESPEGRLRAETRGGRIRLTTSGGALDVLPAHLLELLLAPAPPRDVAAWLAAEGADACLERLPVPFYVWGFDSI